MAEILGDIAAKSDLRPTRRDFLGIAWRGGVTMTMLTGIAFLNSTTFGRQIIRSINEGKFLKDVAEVYEANTHNTASYQSERIDYSENWMNCYFGNQFSVHQLKSEQSQRWAIIGNITNNVHVQLRSNIMNSDRPSMRIPLPQYHYEKENPSSKPTHIGAPRIQRIPKYLFQASFQTQAGLHTDCVYERNPELGCLALLNGTLVACGSNTAQAIYNRQNYDAFVEYLFSFDSRTIESELAVLQKQRPSYGKNLILSPEYTSGIITTYNKNEKFMGTQLFSTFLPESTMSINQGVGLSMPELATAVIDWNNSYNPGGYFQMVIPDPGISSSINTDKYKENKTAQSRSYYSIGYDAGQYNNLAPSTPEYFLGIEHL